MLGERPTTSCCVEPTFLWNYRRSVGSFLFRSCPLNSVEANIDLDSLMEIVSKRNADILEKATAKRKRLYPYRENKKFPMSVPLGINCAGIALVPVVGLENLGVFFLTFLLFDK